MSIAEKYQPNRVFYYFEEICKIPHGSGNTKEISDYLVNFAKEQGLSYYQDEANNVIIYKPGRNGGENAPVVILQGHMDMVCEKEPETEHDFTKDPLECYVEDGRIRARGTTLGGDDGIALAYCLALLESDQLVHPPLEAVFTTDEEIGLLGADFLDCSLLKGKTMINLDMEEEGSIYTGCAGGVTGISEIPVRRVKAEGMKISITIGNLTGGHSGSEIDKNRANANILMGRLLYELSREIPVGVEELSGGQKDNVIPRQCRAVCCIAPEDKEALEEFLKNACRTFRKEYAGSDENIEIQCTVLQELEEGEILHPSSQEKILFYLRNLPWGVQKMSGLMEGLVETSTNPGVMSLKKETFCVISGVRSSVLSQKEELSGRIQYLTEFLGGDYTETGKYPAWEYKPESPLRERMVSIFEKEYGYAPRVGVIHAGLECGIFYNRIADLDCVSIGPDIYDIHTPKEALDIASANRVWEYLLKVLENLSLE